MFSSLYCLFTESLNDSALWTKILSAKSVELFWFLDIYWFYFKFCYVCFFANSLFVLFNVLGPFWLGTCLGLVVFLFTRVQNMLNLMFLMHLMFFAFIEVNTVQAITLVFIHKSEYCFGVSIVFLVFSIHYLIFILIDCPCSMASQVLCTWLLEVQKLSVHMSCIYKLLCMHVKSNKCLLFKSIIH